MTDRLVRGEAWRLVSSMFLRGSPDHLLGNMLALYILGIACEHAFGPLMMLGIYAGAALGWVITPRLLHRAAAGAAEGDP